MRRRGVAVVVSALIAVSGVASSAYAQDGGGWDRLSAHLHAGLCENRGRSEADLAFPAIPQGTALGAESAAPAAVAHSTLPLSVDALLASDHSLDLHAGDETACGDVGGVLDADGSLIVGILGDDSSIMGVAQLSADPADPSLTQVSLFAVGDALARKRATAGGAADSNPASTSTSSDSQTASSSGAVRVDGPQLQVGQVAAGLAVDVVVVGQEVAEELDGVRAEGEFLVIHADLTYTVETAKPFPVSYFVVADAEGRAYDEVRLPSEPLTIEMEFINSALGVAYQPGQVVRERLVYDVPSAAEVCYLTTQAAKNRAPEWVIYLGCNGA